MDTTDDNAPAPPAKVPNRWTKAKTVQTERVLRDSKGREHRISVMSHEAGVLSPEMKRKSDGSFATPSHKSGTPPGLTKGQSAWARVSDRTAGADAMSDLTTRAAFRPEMQRAHTHR